MPQVTARLSPKIRARFDQYAKSVGLDASELARLLIVRELRAPRVLRFQKRVSETHANTFRKYKERKLTAHFHSVDLIAEFDTYSTIHGFNRSDAAKIVFEQELNEKWLRRAFAWTPEPINHHK